MAFKGDCYKQKVNFNDTIPFMHHLVNERKAFLAICFISLGIFVLTQTNLFAAPVLVSEKGLGFLLFAVVLLVSGLVLGTKASRRI